VISGPGTSDVKGSQPLRPVFLFQPRTPSAPFSYPLTVSFTLPSLSAHPPSPRKSPLIPSPDLQQPLTTPLKFYSRSTAFLRTNRKPLTSPRIPSVCGGGVVTYGCNRADGRGPTPRTRRARERALARRRSLLRSDPPALPVPPGRPPAGRRAGNPRRVRAG
jgi:hypothetical protein